MEFENTISNSVTTSFAPSISSAPSFGGGIESSFSFANTVPLSAPSEISLGGTFSDFLFLDTRPMTVTDLGPISLDNRTPIPAVFDIGLADINLDPDIQSPEIPEAFQVGLAEINLDPDLPNYEIPQVFYDAFADEDLLDPQQYFEQINIVDIPVELSRNTVIEQINYSNEPEIAKTEAKLTELFGETPAAPKIETLAFQGDALEPQKISTEFTDMVADAEIAQATVTYESLQVAGMEETEAITITQNALVLTGAKPEVAEQTMIQIKTGTRIAAEVENKIEEKEPSFVKTTAGKEEKKEKIELKFVVDERALAERNTALKSATNNALIKLKDRRIVVDPIKAAANLPREPEKRTLISGILPEYQIDLFGLENGDGSYREAVGHISNLSNLGPNTFLQRGSEIFGNFPPVKIAPTGKVVKEDDVKRVRSYKQDSVRSFRQITTLTNTNTMV